MRDTITPLGAGRKLSVTIEKFGCQIKSLGFEVRSVDGKRLVESTDITQYTEEEDTITASFTIRPD